LNSIDQIVPVYAEAVTLSSTQQQASDELAGELGDVSVVTFEQTPIFEIRARHQNPELAHASVQALADAVEARVAAGEIGISSLGLEQIDMPSVPTDPVFPQPTLTMLVAAVLGLGLGTGAAALRESLTRKIETAEELSKIAGVPCFGELPRAAAVARATTPKELHEDTRLRIFSEAVRNLRTNLLFSTDTDSLRSVLITSPEGASHGKTTVAMALASTFARLGVRALLVDADLRRGRIAELFGVPAYPGLMEALTGEPVEGVIQTIDFENLDILACGEQKADPSEVFESQFLPVLKQLETMYEVIIIDAPPLIVVNDARIMSRFVDSTVMVASAHQATHRQVRAAVEQLQLIGADLSAVVLNRSRSRMAPGYYAYAQPTKRSPQSSA
jgi:capsular exopolysaccharide synthesis family protein